MKLPLTPIALDKLLGEQSEHISDIVRRAFHPTVGGEYVHWDTLRHRKPPTGLSHEQWWLGMKLSRTNQYRALPLLDTHGAAFVYMLPDRVQEALHDIDTRSSGRIGIPDHVTNPDTRDRFIVNSLIEEAITSSQLEGASTTRAVAADMIRAGRRPKDRSEKMILNNYVVMQAIRQIKDEPLTLELLLHLHEMLTADTLDDPGSVGRIQRPDEKRVQVWDNRDQTVLHAPPSATELPQRLEAMVRFANRKPSDSPFIHSAIHAITLHFWLAYEHPFEDGNGRTARALFYWAMLRNGYWMFEFISISRFIKQAPGKYARAFLFTETDGNDLTYFLVQQIEVIAKAIDGLDSYIADKVTQVKNVEQLLKSSTNLNHRQLALLAHAIRHPGAEYTVRSQMRSHDVVYATARADLFRLAELRLLDKRREGLKTNVFHVPPDIEARIRGLQPSDLAGGKGVR